MDFFSDGELRLVLQKRGVDHKGFSSRPQLIAAVQQTVGQDGTQRSAQPHPTMKCTSCSTSGHFLDSVNETLNKGITTATGFFDTLLHKHVDEHSEGRFRSSFQFPPHERLHGEFVCKALSGHDILDGMFYISDNYVCFTAPSHGRQVNVVLPLRSIRTINRAVTSQSSAEAIPSVYALDANNPSANAVQIITNDGLMHQFFGFTVKFNTIFYLLTTKWSKALNTPLVYSPPPTRY